MNFNVEEYLIKEGQIEDPLEDYQNQVEVLKKAGLDTLVSAIETPTIREVPFPEMTKEEVRVYEVYYYYKHALSTFKSIIPLQVASLLALCNEKDYFEKMYIRCDVDINNIMLSTYVAIGQTKRDVKHIIARWSTTSLVSYNTIKEATLPKVQGLIRHKIEEDIKASEIDLSNIEELAKKYLRGEYISYYIT